MGYVADFCEGQKPCARILDISMSACLSLIHLMREQGRFFV
jgi:hypothetical protein